MRLFLPLWCLFNVNFVSQVCTGRFDHVTPPSVYVCLLNNLVCQLKQFMSCLELNQWESYATLQ